jgi:RNA polymerase sigma factor (TIGR02999 family)
VNEAYMRLVGQNRINWESRTQFLGVASQIMRRILVDYARARQAAKRPGAGLQITLDDRIGAVEPPSCDMLLLDHALAELETFDPLQSRIVEMRYFGGLSEQEVAEVLGTSRSTVTREWKIARTWLYGRLKTGAGRKHPQAGGPK